MPGKKRASGWGRSKPGLSRPTGNQKKTQVTIKQDTAIATAHFRAVVSAREGEK